MHKVLIRPLQIQDAATSYKWRNDPKVWKYTGTQPNKIITIEIEEEWLKSAIKDKTKKRFAIEVDDNYIGNIQLTNINERTAEYHIFIGEKKYWNKGIAKLASYQIIRYAKDILKLQSIYLYVKPDNLPAIKAYKNIGFKNVSDEIKMTLQLVDSRKPIVSVFMMVYNHEAYIKQAINNALVQKTEFDFEIVIGEDKSTDNSRELIIELATKYPGKFKLLLHKSNIGAVNNQNEILKNCDGQFIAMCEGDDYWTDPYKLQKQVDYLEANSDVGLVHTAFEYINDNSEKIEAPTPFYKSLKARITNGYVFNDYISKGEFILTLTCVFRKDLLQFTNNCEHIIYDHWIFMEIMRQSKIHYLNEVTGAYRINPNGAVQSKSINLTKLKYQVILDQIKRFYSKGHKTAEYYTHNSKETKSSLFEYLFGLFRLKQIKLSRILINLCSIKPLLAAGFVKYIAIKIKTRIVKN